MMFKEMIRNHNTFTQKNENGANVELKMKLMMINYMLIG